MLPKLNRISVAVALLGLMMFLLSQIVSQSTNAGTLPVAQEIPCLGFDDEEDRDEDRDEDEEDEDRDDDEDEGFEREIHELEFELAHLEAERARLEVGFAGLDMLQRLGEIADNQELSVAYAVMRAGEFLEPDEAIELLEDSLEDASPTVRRLIRMQLLEVYAANEQQDEVEEQLRILIRGK